MNHKAFTLIELLVVVAIIGILAAVGVVAYNGYTQGAKRNATLQQHKQAVRFISSSLKLCDVQGGGTLKLSATRSINCDISNSAGNINSMNDVFINYFLDQGYKNPYNNPGPVVYTARNGANDTDGRLRFDETDCRSSGGKGGYKKLVLWVKTHKDHENTTFLMDNWQQWCDK